MREIHATKGYTFIVDDEDYEKVNQFFWYTQIVKTLNFFSDISGEIAKTIPTYQITFGEESIKDKQRFSLTPEELIFNYNKKTHFVSFINHDRFDFRKENLKLVPIKYLKLHRASPSKNQFMYRGVGKDPNGTYRASLGIKVNGEKKKLMKSGLATLEEAALAYNELAQSVYGEYAYLNIIGKDSRQPIYETITESSSKRSKRASKAEKGYSLVNGRYITQINGTHVLSTSKKEEASFAYNLAALQIYGDKADLNDNLSDKPFWKKWQKKIFGEKVVIFNREYENIFAACLELTKDAVSVYQMIKNGYDINTVFEIAPSNYNTRTEEIRFNKNKYMHECWVNGVFEGFYRTENDAKYAYNKLSNQEKFVLPEGFVGEDMLVGRNSTIIYENKKYTSLSSLAVEYNISNQALIVHSEKFPVAELVDVLKKGYSINNRFLVDGIPYYSLKQFAEEKNLSPHIFNNARVTMRKKNIPCNSIQEVYDFICKRPRS